MLFPKKVKYRKWHRMRRNPKKNPMASRGGFLAFGAYGLKSEEAGEISSAQIEAGRKALTRYVQKTGKIWIRVFPDKPITRKPPEVTLGGGKGDPVGYVVDARAGRIIFELDGLPYDTARQALRRAAAKLSIKTRFVSREK